MNIITRKNLIECIINTQHIAGNAHLEAVLFKHMSKMTNFELSDYYFKIMGCRMIPGTSQIFFYN